ncbi:MAG: hypothetical protein PHU14_16415 [Methylovulum sp.]|nr:hypothetical protein [Methylovulum sp.]
MKSNKLSTLIAATCLILGISQYAVAGDFDFYQSTKSVVLTKTDFSDTNSLGAVAAVCPEAGYLVAQGSAGILLSPVVGDTTGVVQGGISITLDNTAPYAADPHHYNSLVFNTVGNNSATAASLQRIDTCVAGQKITYRLVAWHEYAGALSNAFQPRLVVQFFNNRI